MAKAIKCYIIVNNWTGYCFHPEYFDSVRQAENYGRNFFGGFAWRIFNAETKQCIKRGYCDGD